MNIIIEIDELVLHGFPATDRYRIGEAVHEELARIFAERGLTEGRPGSAGAVLDGNTFHAADMRFATIGAGVAEAVYRTVVTNPQGAAG
jgi:hypothetical protein